ncbi:hypothetical protein [Jiangella alkaliphila]|uniref:Uncharacterized protein n=1 Tax=Jiangella alkaliphila TaxID=419479 RepID=A0A1H2GLH3_9ACTN|nr:hypothetical protein [Jiangella alkaliphila]SDU20415.1 hypothetical protein SAMN04488563_0563 [Jiangella alkaliphila]
MSGSGQSVLRQAVEGLLRARADAERGLDEVAARVATAAVRPAETARAGRHPLARRVADEAAAVGARLPDELAAVATATRMAIATEVHALLDLLAVGHHQLPPLPPLDAGPLAGPGDRAFLAAFSEGFARSYVATVLGDLARGRAVSKADAAAHPGALQVDVDAARSLIVAAVAPEHRELVREWLSHPNCHAVEIHGPQVSDRDLELRAGWTRPPDHGTDSADKWRVRPDGRVVSEHAAGIEASRFSSPEAFARPLGVFLDAAARHPGGLDGLLDQHFPAGIAPIFIDAERARLAPGDVTGVRGAGTGTVPAAKDWRKLRNSAMKKDGECLPPVHTVPYDPFQDGSDAGVRLIFKKRGTWSMTTYYPTGEPAHDNVRLEELT